MRGIAAAIGGSVGVVVATACQDPTQITLTLRTNAVCSDVDGTAIIAGEPGRVEHGEAAAITSSCTERAEGGRIGSIVLVPNDDKDAAVGVRIAMSLGGSLESCLEPPYGETCIIARRSLRYIPQTPLTLPIELGVECVGTFCTELTTCVGGTCVDATVDPNDCIGPDGCEPKGDPGTGGGGPEGCDPPTTTARVAVTGAGVERDALTVAVDGATCRWALAWSEVGSEICTRLVEPDGALSPGAVCDARAAVADVDLAPLGGGIFALADWGSDAHLSTLTTDGIVARGALSGAVGGAIATRDDTLLMIFTQSDGPIGHATYRWDGASLSLEMQQTLLANDPGSGLAVALGPTDAVMSWKPSNQLGQVLRFKPGGPPGDPTEIEAITNIALANHAPTGVTGIIFNDSAGNGELATWAPGGTYTSAGASAVDYSGTATNFAIAGTTTGWVVAYTDGGRGYLTSFASDGTYILTVREVAPDATAIAIAAAGDQLGVTWRDAQGAIWFRRVAFDLSTL